MKFRDIRNLTGIRGVSTLAVEWIEIVIRGLAGIVILSPPSRWSGLKSGKPEKGKEDGGLHPRGGVD